MPLCLVGIIRAASASLTHLLFHRPVQCIAQLQEFRADNVVDYSMDKVGNGQTRTATAHFVAYGGGNALVLMDKPNRAAKVVDDEQKQEFIEGKARRYCSPRAFSLLLSTYSSHRYS